MVRLWGLELIQSSFNPLVMKWSLGNTVLLLVGVTLVYAMGYSHGTYDEKVIVEQPEYNHVVRHGHCYIMCDTSNQIFSIEYRGEIYVLDTTATENL